MTDTERSIREALRKRGKRKGFILRTLQNGKFELRSQSHVPNVLKFEHLTDVQELLRSRATT